MSIISFIAISFMTFALGVSKEVMSSFVLAIEDDIRIEQVIDQNNSALRKSLGHIDRLLLKHYRVMTKPKQMPLGK